MKWTGLLAGERAIGENSIIPTHLVYYHTANPVMAPFDFQMSYKALSKWRFTWRCSGEKGGGGRRSDGQIQSSTMDIRTTRVNNDLNLHMVALTLFYA